MTTINLEKAFMARCCKHTKSFSFLSFALGLIRLIQKAESRPDFVTYVSAQQLVRWQFGECVLQRYNDSSTIVKGKKCGEEELYTRFGFRDVIVCDYMRDFVTFFLKFSNKKLWMFEDEDVLYFKTHSGSLAYN